ncbi:hypothetical protein IGS59_27775 [Janthinobacterium sp. GW460P]|uniref:hypothetical protein n=1 Tax=unclassified Janthinobacterium TaxID=2610881 RepID=UPI000A3228DE|nr:MULTISPECIES: hypothetical protein [unclassified Janthinobacterium]MCC7706048.1 hypothetical protein [Janthinobacterium sp. GW460P]MCC7711550.1 hypothetical protein [Janthinobacterium sp. GW460W]
MEFKYYVYCFADIMLIVTSLIFGLKFLKKRNYLLGGELLVVGFSATNLLINALTELPAFLNVSLFCDAFSRAFGIPVITVAGMMVATHRFRPSTLLDVTLFTAGLAVTVFVWQADFLSAVKPYFYLVMWTLFSVYLLGFAFRLARAGEKLQAASVVLAMLFAQTIASIYDFYHIPGDDDHVIFYSFALLAWSFLGFSLYHAYCALERLQSRPHSLS